MSSTTRDSENPGLSDAGDVAAADIGRGSTLRTWLFVVAGIISGLGGGFLGHKYYGSIPRPEMSEKYYKESEERWATGDFSPDVAAEMKDKGDIKVARNTSLALAIIGGLLGGTLCLMTGAVRKRAMVILVGTIGGVLAGVVSGAIAGHAGVWMSRYLERFQGAASSPQEVASGWLREMYMAVAIHATEWSLVGLGVGLAVAMAAGRNGAKSRMIGYAIVGGLVAAVLYTPLAAFLFPSDKSGIPFPDGALQNRLLFATLPCLAMGVLLAMSFADRRKVAVASTEGTDVPEPAAE